MGGLFSRSAEEPKQAPPPPWTTDTDDDDNADLKGGGEQPAIKRVFFDFDLTISRCHVFKLLAGWERQCAPPPPAALTDRGQISKIAALNAQGPCWAYDETQGGIVSVEPSVGEPWTKAALGGAARVDMLRSLFADLRAKGVVLTIITKGYVGAVRKLLTEEGLLENFDIVIGFIGKFYGENEYDTSCEASSLEGGAENELRNSKALFVQTALQREGLSLRQAVLVEDDPAEIASVRQPPICRAVYVRKRMGMMSAEMDRLRQLASPASGVLTSEVDVTVQ